MTLPIEMRRKLGIEEGGIVAFVQTDGGILISRPEVIAIDALDRIGEALMERGISLEELIDSGREIRGQMVEKEYGLRSESNG